MRLYTTLQRKDGRFDFTCQYDERAFPVGYCAPYKEWKDGELGISADSLLVKEYEKFKDKHHDNGHATREEAVACYREYLLDSKLSLNLESDNTQHKCQVCGEWTNLSAHLDMDRWDLCSEHNNREEVEKLFELSPDIEIWSSY